jgi:cell division protease FtsH
MDGFHREEMVFIVGTTNFVEVLDPALLRPGRFEFHLHIPYPSADDRRAILRIYDKKMRLKMSDEALEYAVRRTGEGYVTQTGTPFSGDHLNALCRAVARIRLREDRSDDTKPEDIDRAFTEFEEKLDLTPREERLLATHEAGHAVVSINCPLHPPIERITIKSETTWAPAYVRYTQDDSRRLGLTRNQMMEDLCVLLGGIEAERLLLEDVSTGAAGSDLERATRLAHYMIEVCGMGGPELGLRQFRNLESGERFKDLSPDQLATLDRRVSETIGEAQERTAGILKANRAVLEMLRDLLIEKKTIDARTLGEMVKDAPKKARRAEG